MATKSRGIGRGGPRPGGGRPKGSKNKQTILTELLPAIEAHDWEQPLFGLLARIADPALGDERYRDMLRIAVLPYLHSRPRSDATAKAPFQMTDAELIAVRDTQLEHERQLQLSKGRLRLIKGPGV